MTDEPTPVAIWPVWWQQIVSSQRREARRLVAELIAVRGVMPLLMKARNGGRWTAGEKQELLVHLRRMALLSPYLPGSVPFQGATFNSRAMPGVASPAHNQKNPVQPSASTSQPADALIKVRGTAAKLVKRAICVAV